MTGRRPGDQVALPPYRSAAALTLATFCQFKGLRRHSRPRPSFDSDPADCGDFKGLGAKTCPKSTAERRSGARIEVAKALVETVPPRAEKSGRLRRRQWERLAQSCGRFRVLEAETGVMTTLPVWRTSK